MSISRTNARALAPLLWQQINVFVFSRFSLAVAQVGAGRSINFHVICLVPSSLNVLIRSSCTKYQKLNGPTSLPWMEYIRFLKSINVSECSLLYGNAFLSKTEVTATKEYLWEPCRNFRLHYFCSCFILYSSFSLISHLSLPAFPTFVVSSHNVFCTCLCLLWTYKLWVLVLADNTCMYSAFNSAVFPVAWLIFCWISYQTLIYNNRYQIFEYLILNLWILSSFGLCSIERYIIKRLWWLI